MKQLSNKKLCKYCLGCVLLEEESFEGVMNCKNFVQGKEVSEFYKTIKKKGQNYGKL